MKLDDLTEEISKLEDQLQALDQHCSSLLTDANTELSKINLSTSIEELQTTFSQLERTLESLQQELARKFQNSEGEALLSLEEIRELVASLAPGTSHEKDQHKTPFGVRSLECLRKLLFLTALQVNQFFVIENWKLIKQALKIWADLVRKRINLEEVENVGDLVRTAWGALFAICPVISTTYHSVKSLFYGVEKNMLGLIISDESGQALPYMALGVLYRGKGFVAVGDPLQLEPVTTAPAWVRACLDKKFELSKTLGNQAGLYLPGACQAIRGPNLEIDTSVQVLADRASPVFDTVHCQGQSVEVGVPLWIHFRCASPIYDIANQIAYGGNMVQAKWMKNEPGFALWINVEDPAMTSNVSDLEIEAAFKVMLGECRTQDIKEALASIGLLPDEPLPLEETYVISPFKEIRPQIYRLIANRLRDRNPLFTQFLKMNWRGWVNRHVGTVHTFQGKEAKMVFFCLGGKTPGAKKWATKKPNLWNVAVTRAKRGLFIVGNFENWKEIKPEWFDSDEENSLTAKGYFKFVELSKR